MAKNKYALMDQPTLVATVADKDLELGRQEQEIRTLRTERNKTLSDLAVERAKKTPVNNAAELVMSPIHPTVLLDTQRQMYQIQDALSLICTDMINIRNRLMEMEGNATKFNEYYAKVFEDAQPKEAVPNPEANPVGPASDPAATADQH